MKGIVDVVFLVDATGSMQGCIDILKLRIDDLFRKIVCPDSYGVMSCVGDWRAKIVGFRDYEYDGPEKWFVDNPFTRDAAELQRQLSALETIGGGDQPESLLDAIYKVADMGATAHGEESPNCWRARHDAARLLFVFTDAPYKSKMVVPDLAGGDIREVGYVCVANRIRMTVFAPRGGQTDEQYELIEDIRYGQWVKMPRAEDGGVDWRELDVRTLFMPLGRLHFTEVDPPCGYL